MKTPTRVRQLKGLTAVPLPLILFEEGVILNSLARALLSHDSAHLEAKIHTKSDNKPEADHDGTYYVIEVLATSLLNHPTTNDINPPTPSSSEQRNDRVYNCKDTSDIIEFSSSIVQAEGQGSKKNRYVLPLDERSLISKPDFRFNSDWIHILDEFARFSHTRR